MTAPFPTPTDHLSAEAVRFLNANASSPVVYGSVDADGVTYRLASGQVFRLSPDQARHVDHPRWAHRS